MNSLLLTCLHAHHRHLRHLHPLVHHSHMALCRSLNLTLELLTPVVSHNLPCLAFALLWIQFMLSTSKKRKTWKCVYKCLFQLRPSLQESRSGGARLAHLFNAVFIIYNAIIASCVYLGRMRMCRQVETNC